MDLFNRKALALAGERLSALERDLDYQKTSLSAVQLEREAALRSAHELEVKNAVLLERLDLLTSGLLDKPTAPQSWTEDVEDAEYLFKTGRLDKAEFEAALEAAGFANTEIEFDSGSLPRI